MPRQLRIQYPGACYHVMARGNRRQAIVTSEEDRKLFVTTLGEVCGRTGWEVLAWVLRKGRGTNPEKLSVALKGAARQGCGGED